MTNLQYLRYLIFSLFLTTGLYAQPVHNLPPGELKLEMEKLLHFKRALYIAAHPDDENTRLLAWLTHAARADAAYISLTRGDGGQNLIGPEQGPWMGVLRTYELLAARRRDKARQFFSRAVDFGYSKTADETLTIWEREEVLRDMVWVIRKYRPDVLITRFPENGYGGHGHHLASAMLARKAFDAAGDAGRFADQLEEVEPWQPLRLLYNASSWWNPDLPETASKNDSIFSVNVGEWMPLLGQACSELAAESRSMHKSQGFGAGKSRGSKPEFLQHVAGEVATTNIFEGVRRSWSDFKGGEAVATHVQAALQAFKADDPTQSLPHLLRARQAIDKMESDNFWVDSKQQALDELIRQCAGIWLEARAHHYYAHPGEEMEVTMSLIGRTKQPLRWLGAKWSTGDTTFEQTARYDDLLEVSVTPRVLADAPYRQPHWLTQPPGKGMFQTGDVRTATEPVVPSPLHLTFKLELDGQLFQYTLPVRYRWVDRVEGELYRPVVTAPPATLNFDAPWRFFKTGHADTVRIHVEALMENIQGKVMLEIPEGWEAAPAGIPVDIGRAGDATTVAFRVTPGKNTSGGRLKAVLHTDNKTYSHALQEIDYPHIPKQVFFPEASISAVQGELTTQGRHIGYIMGAGDEVPDALRQMGYGVTLLKERDVLEGNLERFDAIMTGIRAYNTEEWLRRVQHQLLKYVNNGGRYIVQYNTSRGLVTGRIGPYALELGRDRITDETADLTFLAPDHPVLNQPNTLSSSDFEGWIQERGLYFAREWDERYTPLLAGSDPGEEPVQGSLLVAEYGDGVFVYTGLSLFRQLPAGVPGAYRLLANILACE